MNSNYDFYDIATIQGPNYGFIDFIFQNYIWNGYAVLFLFNKKMFQNPNPYRMIRIIAYEFPFTFVPIIVDKCFDTVVIDIFQVCF